MTTIVDPDFLTDSAVNRTAVGGPTVFIDTALRTIRLNNGQNGTEVNASGALLDEDGVTLQGLYSFLKQQWKDDPRSKDLISYPFPLTAITPEQFEFNFGWKMADDSSRDLIRTGGWREIAENNSTVNREYLGVISLGNIDGDQNQDGGGDQDTVYYAFFDSATNAPKSGILNMSFPGEVNQAINTFVSGGDDFRGDILRLFVREEAKTYDQTDTRDIGISAGTQLPFNVQRFPLVEGVDLNVTVADAVINPNSQAGEKYDSADNNGPTIKYSDTALSSATFGYTKELTGGPHNFGVVIDADNGTGSGQLSKNELYSWVQYRLRSEANIEDSATASKLGKLQDELLQFVGPTLKTKNATNVDGGGTGVAITNFQSTDVNNVAFLDNTLTERAFPFTANGTITFSDTIIGDSAEAKFFVYYDHTRRYGDGTTTVAVQNVGAAAGDAALDSANILLTGFDGGATEATDANPVTTGGVDAGTEGDNYIKLSGLTETDNNGVILKVVGTTGTASAPVLRVNTLDDVDLATSAPQAAGRVETHPINSPGAVLVDSAGTAVENTGGVTATLAPANLTGSSFTFTYDYDGNTQKDRVDNNQANDPEIVIRAIGLNSGSWVQLTGQVIDRIDNNPYSVVSALERNYSDPE
jgi:hypothetical protein